ANEAAHYEFGASLAGQCVRKVLDEVTEGKTELELAQLLSAYGQPLSVQTICASGQRFTNAVAAPRKKKAGVGEQFTVTMGLRGGLTCRTGYVVGESRELPREEKDYLEQAAKPYYRALAVWYSETRIGRSAGEIYSEIEQVIPKSIYGWKLNPGHYTAGEEWMSSPFWEGSEIILKSGMLLQMDIIIKVPGYGGANAEDGILLADEQLRREIKDQYPQVWNRMMRRRTYMREILGIPIGDDMLPMSGICGYYRPYVLNKDWAFKIKVTP
ncbi:MAG: M24 family metallopeptidase, partial [Eubacteriales bacterium]|nr:M24 family metallopeptidase [Eubacteriales bacterium]